jgi:hypothetical protein
MRCARPSSKAVTTWNADLLGAAVIAVNARSPHLVDPWAERPGSPPHSRRFRRPRRSLSAISRLVDVHHYRHRVVLAVLQRSPLGPGDYLKTPCCICRGSSTLKTAIDRPSRKPQTAIVVKNVAVDCLKKAGDRAPKNRQVIETKGKTSRGIHPRSTEPKTVSATSRKRLFFNYLGFTLIRASC